MPAPRRSLAVLATHVRARHTSASDGFSIPAGWMVMWPVTPSHTSYGVYTDPARFDPDRFSPHSTWAAQWSVRLRHRNHYTVVASARCSASARMAGVMGLFSTARKPRARASSGPSSAL